MTSPLRILRVVAVAMASVIALATPAQADILLEFDRLISGVEGSVRTIGEVEVAADLVGQTCQVSVIGGNQASVHPGNDLIVSTGGSSEVVVGVEDEVDAGINHTSQLVLGPTIVVQLRFGPDELSSLGFSLSFDCTAPVTTTTSTTIVVPGSPGANCGDGAATSSDSDAGTDSGAGDGVTGQSTTGSAGAGAAGSDCAPVSCTDDGSAVATTVTTAATGSAAAGADGSDCAPANCTDGGESTVTTASTGDTSAAVSDGCPDPASNQSPTTAPPAATTPTTPSSTTTTVASSGSATVALPQSPVATAIAAAPAYAG